jgi:predicted lipid-binding transport protein (Tim44 family)
MKLNKITQAIILSLSLSLLGADIANAKRFGGGKSYGRQNTTAIQRAQNPSSVPAMPTQQNQGFQQQAPQYRPQQNNMPQQPASRPGMGGMLGGLAAGAGLGWLASSMFGGSSSIGSAGGGGSGIFSMLMWAAIAFFGYKMFKKFKAAKMQQSMPGNSNINNPNNTNSINNINAYSGNNQIDNQPAFGSGTSYTPQLNQAQSQSTVGLYPDAINALVNNASSIFKQVQALSDNKNLIELKPLLSPELFASISADLQSRVGNSFTTVQSIDSSLLDWRDSTHELLATIRYIGVVNEDGEQSNVNEAWTFIQDKTQKDGANSDKWVIDGISQLS